MAVLASGSCDPPPSRPDLAFQVDSRALNQTQIGGVLRGVLPLASFATVRVSTFLGYRTYELPVTSFAKIPCTPKCVFPRCSTR